jgi:hypothetical protein
MFKREPEQRADAILAQRLLRGGVAPHHVQRTLRELRDHRSDLAAQLEQQGHGPVDARQEAQRRLGQRNLARQMLARPELRSRACRFAWLLFGAGPVLAIATLCGGVVFAMVALYGDAPAPPESDLQLVRRVLTTFELLVLWIIPACVGLALCHIAARRWMPPTWPLFSVLLTALMSGITRIEATPLRGAMSITVGAPPLHIPRTLTLICGLLIAYLLARHATQARHPTRA